MSFGDDDLGPEYPRCGERVGDSQNRANEGRAHDEVFCLPHHAPKGDDVDLLFLAGSNLFGKTHPSPLADSVVISRRIDRGKLIGRTQARYRPAKYTQSCSHH
jgi:hypothetical protein